MVKSINASPAYIDGQVSKFLAQPLPKTAHYCVTGDKLTNHSITNQATLIFPVVNGQREAIVLDAQPVQITDLKNRTGFSLYFWETEAKAGHIEATT